VQAGTQGKASGCCHFATVTLPDATILMDFIRPNQAWMTGTEVTANTKTAVSFFS
jgi:hypothetical protein